MTNQGLCVRGGTEAEFRVRSATFLAGPGGYVAAPAGAFGHGFRNAGQGDPRLLKIHAPNVGFAERIRRE